LLKFAGGEIEKSDVYGKLAPQSGFWRFHGNLNHNDKGI